MAARGRRVPGGRLFGMRLLGPGRTAIFLAALVLSAAAPAQKPDRPFPGFILARAVANYNAVMRGARRLEDLDAFELREVREIQREIRAEHVAPATSREQCIAQQTRARGGNLTALAAQIVDLACSQR